MKTLISKLSHSICSCFVVLVSASYAHADDTEIFFGTSSATDTLPNVLFILDNSGSMDNYVTAETNYDNTIDYIQQTIDEGRSTISDTYIYLSKADSGTFSL